MYKEKIYKKKSKERFFPFHSILNSGLLIIIVLFSVIDVTKAGCSITPDSNGNVVIDNTVISISDGDFNGCTDLISLEFTETSSLITIGGYAFNECTNLASVIIPASVVTISENAFYGCTSLASVTFGTNSQLDTIGNAVFKGAIFTSIALPNTLTSIGNYAFYQSSLQTITMSNQLSRLISIGTSVFQQSVLTEFICPQTLTSIGEAVFANTPIDSFVVDCHSTMTISENAFLDTPNLSEIELPSSATCNNCGVTTTAWAQGPCGPTQSPTAAPTQSPTAAPTQVSDSKEDSNSNSNSNSNSIIIIIVIASFLIISALGWYMYFRYKYNSNIKVVELIVDKDDEL